MAESSSSGLTFKLHPLVIVNISDHYSRVKSQMYPPVTNTSTPPPPNSGADGAIEAASSSSFSDSASRPRVFGCVIGVQRGRTVEIFNSFELLYDPATHSLDRAFLEKKQELYKKVFPHFYVLGWYFTGTGMSAGHGRHSDEYHHDHQREQLHVHGHGAAADNINGMQGGMAQSTTMMMGHQQQHQGHLYGSGYRPATGHGRPRNSFFWTNGWVAYSSNGIHCKIT